MVAYTAPVFWFFMLLVSISIYIFRSRETGEVTHYRVPLYPVTPAILALTCAWMLYSSLAYAGWGSIIGVVILLLGTPLSVPQAQRRVTGRLASRHGLH